MLNIGIRVPENIVNRLGALAHNTKRTMSYYVREAILLYLDQQEKIYLSGTRIENLKKGESPLYTSGVIIEDDE